MLYASPESLAWRDPNHCSCLGSEREGCGSAVLAYRGWQVALSNPFPESDRDEGPARTSNCDYPAVSRFFEGLGWCRHEKNTPAIVSLICLYCI